MGLLPTESSPSIALQDHALRRYLVAKRILDVCVAALVLGVFSPLWGAIALCIRLTSPGPALFRGQVAGQGGRLFIYYKFRTMYADREDTVHRRWLEAFVREDRPFVEGSDGGQKPVYKVVNDPRVTPVGRVLRRLSLDEAPQLLNVLRGEMSIVGPRPPVVHEYQLYDDWAKQRLAVPPGVTGLYQVSARSAVGFRAMVEIDLDYIRRRSFWLDLKIMLLTPWAMLTGRGAG